MIKLRGPVKLEELLSLSEASEQEAYSESDSQQADKYRYPFWLKPLVLAASILFLFFNVPNWIPNDEKDIASMGQDIAQEIYLNHDKNLKIEYEGENYVSLQKEMKKLDFKMFLSSRLSSSGYRVIGGRYCTIQGQIASQIKLQDSEGRHGSRCIKRGLETN